MRERKFRAWHRESKTMFHVRSIDFLNEEINTYEMEGDWIGFGDVEILPYIDFKDKHDKETYRGDILKYTPIIYTDCSQTEIDEVLEPGLIELIYYSHMASIIKPLTENVEAHGWDRETGEGLVIGLTSEELEVIGNIYENPELIERWGKY